MKKHSLILLLLILLAVIVVVIKLLPNGNEVTVEIKKDSISNTGVSILITDKSSNRYEWGSEYYLQVKKDNEWKKVESIASGLSPDNIFVSFWYGLDENHQLSQSFNWSTRYGELPSGIYRVEKPADDNTTHEEVYFYSNEFEIK